jgi:hypothetical protein
MAPELPPPYRCSALVLQSRRTIRAMRFFAAFALLSTLAGASASAPSAANCSGTSVPMTPLIDLGAATYDGYHGGLYPAMKNAPSNAEKIKDPSYAYWSRVDRRLAAAGTTAAQVQAVWLKEAIAQENEPFPADALRLRSDLGAIVQILEQRYPSLNLIYVSSRTYGGYATTTLSPEPFAYDSGFAVKWLVGHAADGHLKARPWVGWGPYLWTNGTKGRSDGLTWTCDDVRPQDGTHPSAAGQRKVAGLLVHFLQTSPTTKSWFGGS